MIDLVDEEEEEWDKLHKLSNWEMLAWRRVGYTPYDADNIATRAVALKKHTPAVMAATSSSSSASSLFSSSSSPTNLFQRSRPTSAVPLASHLAKAPEPSATEFSVRENIEALRTRAEL